MNVITISKPDQPAGAASTMFAAPDNPREAHALFLFLAEHLQPGFVVELAADGRSITQATRKGQNEKIPSNNQTVQQPTDLIVRESRITA